MPAPKHLTPEQRSQRARVAALARWSREDPKANGERGQAGLIAKLEREVDPDGVLPEKERRRRVECRRREHMARLSFKASKARSARRSA